MGNLFARVVIVSISLLLMTSAVIAQEDWTTESLEWEGITRQYRVFAPTTIPDGAQLPLIIAIHGGTGTARAMAIYTNFHILGATEGFIVVYPQSVDENWNDGRIPQSPSVRAQFVHDDVGFINALIDRLLADYPIDPTRIYATGISNGGHMALRLACEMSDRIAAIAAVTANLSADLDCQPTTPLGVLVINGDADPLVPYDGGIVARNRGTDLSTAETMRFWQEANGCDPDPVQTRHDAVPDDETALRIDTYPNCARDVRTTLVTVEGGGHTWPGAWYQYLPVLIVGRTSQEMNATEAIWAFFQPHSR